MRGWKRALRGGGRDPHDADADLRAALLAVLDRDTERAEQLLGDAVRADSSAVEPYLALGRLYRMRGEVGRAIRVHQNLLLRSDLRPEQSAAALADLAADFRQGGFLQRAIASYEEVLGHDAAHRGALRALVPLHASARNYRRAVEVTRRLAKLEGRDAAASEAALWVELAEFEHAEGRSDEARRVVKRALRRDRSAVRGWILLGRLEAERGRPKAALAAWSRVPAIDRAAAAAVYPLIEATYAALDRARDYETYLRDLVEEQPDDGRALLSLARALAARGEVDDAVATLRRAQERDPENLALRGALGRVLLAAGREAETLCAYGELLDQLEARGLLADREKLA